MCLQGTLPLTKAPLALILSQRPAGGHSSQQPHPPSEHATGSQLGSQESAGGGGGGGGGGGAGGSQGLAGRHPPANQLHSWLQSRGKQQQQSVPTAPKGASWLPASTLAMEEVAAAAAQASPQSGSQARARNGLHLPSEAVHMSRRQHGDGPAPGSGSCSQDLWCEKHAPHSSEELVIQKKKVTELRSWMQAHLPDTQRKGIPRVLLVTGAWVGG